MAVVLVALLDRLLIGPGLDKLKDLDQEINNQRTSISRDLRFLTYKTKIDKEIDAFRKFIPQKAMAEDDINTDFFSRVEKLANQTNVKLVKSNPGPGKKEKEYSEYYADVECAGSLKDVISFMHAVNSSDDLFKIVKFNMTPRKGSPSDVSTSMTVVKLVINPDKPAHAGR